MLYICYDLMFGMVYKITFLPNKVHVQLCSMTSAMTIEPTGSTQLAIRLPTITVVKPNPFTNRSLRWSWAKIFAELNRDKDLQYIYNINLTANKYKENIVSFLLMIQKNIKLPRADDTKAMASIVKSGEWLWSASFWDDSI